MDGIVKAPGQVVWSGVYYHPAESEYGCDSFYEYSYEYSYDPSSGSPSSVRA